MKPDQQGAFDAFMQTGKVSDYLRYIDQKQQVTNATGESIAYYDGSDRSAGAAGRGN